MRNYLLFLGALLTSLSYTHSQPSWKSAETLAEGDYILLANGALAHVKSIISSLKNTKVHNFSVAGMHNYYIGHEGLLVHNADCWELQEQLNELETLERKVKTGVLEETEKVTAKIDKLKTEILKDSNYKQLKNYLQSELRSINETLISLEKQAKEIRITPERRAAIKTYIRNTRKTQKSLSKQLTFLDEIKK